jgi:hypothetical protein
MRIQPHRDEITADLPGDDLVPDAEVVMDRGFDLPAPPAAVWPWLAQLGKNRAGWYLPHAVERFVPPRWRALRHIEESLQHLRPGDIIDDWGGRDATFEIVTHDPPSTLVHRSTRGAMRITWTITLHPTTAGARVHLRLRLAGLRHRRLAEYGGGFIDLVTIAGLAAGLRERLTQ